MRRFWLALVAPLFFACDRAPSGSSAASGAPSAAVPEGSEALPLSPAPSAVAPSEQVEIRACAPLADGELRLFDVEAHTAARLIAIARRTPVVAAGKPERGCVGRCRDLALHGPADADLASVGFEVTRADGLLLAAPTKPAARKLADGGPRIDIERERASFSELAVLLGGSERVARNATASLTGELTIVARNVPADRLLDAAALLGGGRLRATAKRVVLEGVRGVAPVGRLELPDCVAPVCPVVVARCSDTKQLRLVGAMRRTPLRAVPQPLQLGEGIKESDLSAFVTDESGMTWLLRVGDLVGHNEVIGSHDRGVSEPRKVEAISCGAVTLDDGSTITPAR